MATSGVSNFTATSFKHPLQNGEQPPAKKTKIDDLTASGESTELTFKSYNHADITKETLSKTLLTSPHLEVINMTFSEIVDDDFGTYLEKCKNLHTLILRFCPNLSDKTIEDIAQHCPNLKLLDLENCQGLKGAAFFRLAEKSDRSFKSLETLRIGCNSSINDECIKKITLAASHLKNLNLNNCSNIENDSIMTIGRNLKTLEILDISSCKKITDQAFLALDNKDFPNLKELNMEGTQLSIQTIKKLTQMGFAKHLETFSIHNCENLNNESLEYLPLFSSLKKLDLGGIHLEFSGVLNKLQECKSLETLNLNGITAYFQFSSLSTKDVIHIIEKMPQLKTVSVLGLEDRFEMKSLFAEKRPTLHVIASLIN